MLLQTQASIQCYPPTVLDANVGLDSNSCTAFYLLASFEMLSERLEKAYFNTGNILSDDTIIYI